MAKIDFKECWKLPFRYDGYGYIWSDDNVMVFTFNDPEDCSEEAYKKMDDMALNFVSLLNGEGGEKIPNLVVRGGVDLYIEGNIWDKHIGYFRGWGHLTGSGALRMSEQDAAEVQDEFIAWCLEKLSDNG